MSVPEKQLEPELQQWASQFDVYLQDQTTPTEFLYGQLQRMHELIEDQTHRLMERVQREEELCKIIRLAKLDKYLSGEEQLPTVNFQ